MKIYDKNVHFSKLFGANKEKEYILSKISYISKFIVKDSKKIVKDSEVIVVVNKEREFSTILEEVAEDTIIYDLVNIDFKYKHKTNNYLGIAW